MAHTPQPADVSRASLAGFPVIPESELVFNRASDEIGSGQFGTVYRANCRGNSVAVKVIKCPANCATVLQEYRKEVSMLKNIRVPNVVQFLGVCAAPGELMIVTELLKADLSQVLQDPEVLNSLSLDRRLQMAREAACGMSWLHGICHIIHCDLKPANLLLDEAFHVKVCDFGLATEQMLKGLNFEGFSLKGTLIYMAPERLSCNPFNEKSDVYSYGLILFELFTGSVVYEHHDKEDEFIQAVTTLKERPVFPENCTLPAELVSLIKSCWDADYKNRPLFPQVVSNLEALHMDVVLGHTNIATFWRSHFSNPFLDEVTFSMFVQKLQINLQTEFNVEELEGLKKLMRSLSNKTSLEPMVTMQMLKELNEWFGDFFCPPYGSAVAHEMCFTSTRPWFHFNLPRPMADSRLSCCSVNTFLVRLSSTNPTSQPFTISKMYPGRKPLHRRVDRVLLTSSQKPLSSTVDSPSSSTDSITPTSTMCPSTMSTSTNTSSITTGPEDTNSSSTAPTTTIVSPSPSPSPTPTSTSTEAPATETASTTTTPLTSQSPPPPQQTQTPTPTATATTTTTNTPALSSPHPPQPPAHHLLSVTLSKGGVVQRPTLSELIDALVKMGALGTPCPLIDPPSTGTPYDDLF
ncbi:SHK1 protein [Pelomyxa schiedti]|nr:SHK1 protein [Pelomyxa schiedti]